MEDKDNLTLVDEKINSLVQELDDPDLTKEERDSKMDMITELTKVRESYVRTEQQRLDSNAKNDIAEAELVIKQREAKNGKIRNIVTVFTSVFTVAAYTAAAFLMNRESYHMEETTLPYKPAKESSKDMLRNVQKGK